MTPHISTGGKTTFPGRRRRRRFRLNKYGQKVKFIRRKIDNDSAMIPPDAEIFTSDFRIGKKEDSDA
jgi:hypothetical protein